MCVVACSIECGNKNKPCLVQEANMPDLAERIETSVSVLYSLVWYLRICTIVIASRVLCPTLSRYKSMNFVWNLLNIIIICLLCNRYCRSSLWQAQSTVTFKHCSCTPFLCLFRRALLIENAALLFKLCVWMRCFLGTSSSCKSRGTSCRVGFLCSSTCRQNSPLTPCSVSNYRS